MSRKVPCICVGLGLVVLASTAAGIWRLHASREDISRISPKPLLSPSPSRPTSQLAQASQAGDLHAARKDSTDYRNLVNQLLPLANGGSVAAQYEIAKALHYCEENSHLVISRKTGEVITPEEIHQLYTKLPENTQRLVEDAYQRCRSFVGDMGLLKTSETWLDQAEKAGYAPAIFMKAELMRRTLLVEKGDSAALQQATHQAIIASTSGDPGVLFGMAEFVDGAGKSNEQVAKLVSAWWLVGCESGYDCSAGSDAIKGMCTLDAQCANGPTVIEEIQRKEGANFGEVEQLAGQIKAAVSSNDPEEIKKYL